jgi:hypothetical protein
MPAAISDLFNVDIIETFTAAAAAKVVTNSGRTFRVVQALGTGLNGSVITVQKKAADGTLTTIATCTLATGDLNAFPSVMGTSTECTFTATDNISISAATANASRVTLLCVASDGQALTVT